MQQNARPDAGRARPNVCLCDTDTGYLIVVKNIALSSTRSKSRALTSNRVRLEASTRSSAQLPGLSAGHRDGDQQVGPKRREPLHGTPLIAEAVRRIESLMLPARAKFQVPLKKKEGSRPHRVELAHGQSTVTHSGWAPIAQPIFVGASAGSGSPIRL